MGYDKFYRKTVMKSGSAVYGLKTYSQSLTPNSIPLKDSEEQTFTVTGLTTDDIVLAVNPPAHSGSLGSGSPFNITGMRVSAANTLAITFHNPWDTAGTPTTGTYQIVVIRD